MSQSSIHSEHTVESQVRSSQPRQFSVVLLNDDFTPMDFVIGLLMQVFKLPSYTALNLAGEVHLQGSGVAGVYNHEIAETKAWLANEIARQDGHPFTCRVEPV